MIKQQTIHPARFFWSFLLLCFASINHTIAASPLPDSSIDYDINVRIDPETRLLEGQSVITFKRTREMTLVLDGQYEITQALFNGQSFDPQTRKQQSHTWQVPVAMLRPHKIEIHWRGKLHPLDDKLDHEQTLGRAIAVSGKVGTFLPKASNWYPRVLNGLIRYTLQLELPAGQRALVPGRLIDKQDTETGYQARFEFPHPTEGIDLMAGPYEITSDTTTGLNDKTIQLRTYFHPQVNHLANEYLESVKRYFQLYESWIGAYPFSEFSIVSSPTPTGLGMPTLTYLGTRVLQLPFIRDTSLGHEVLHNWWGNGVYPDYRSGNWSEGLTTFMADYTYKEQESEEAALEMRIGWLRDFAALEPGQDKPLSTFTSRTHGASKIVGYHKSAMVFLMLRDLVGEAMFDRSIQGFWTMQRFKVTNWSHLQKAFEIVTGQNLQTFFDQWLNRAGAPDPVITNTRLEQTNTGYQLALSLKQSEPPYHLRVPVSLNTSAGKETHILELKQTEQTFTLDLENNPQSAVLDPEVRLFRHLAADEAPPILREVMVHPATQTVLLSADKTVRQTATTLAEKMQRRNPKIIAPTQSTNTAPQLVIGLQNKIAAWLEANNLPSQPNAVSKKDSSAQVWTLRGHDGHTIALISAKNASSLKALIRPLPHYGRQSYIVFNGRNAIDKDVWPLQLQAVEIDTNTIN